MCVCVCVCVCDKQRIDNRIVVKRPYFIVTELGDIIPPPDVDVNDDVEEEDTRAGCVCPIRWPLPGRFYGVFVAVIVTSSSSPHCKQQTVGHRWLEDPPHQHYVLCRA